MQLSFHYAAGANCCERVRWALDYKQIPYTLIDHDGEFDRAHFAAISPFGRVPMMEVDGAPLSESMAMLELLEEIAPAPALTYSTPFARARVREVCEAVGASIHPVQNSSIVAWFQPGWSKAEMRPVRARWIANNLAKLAPRLWHDSGFVVGTQFTMADIFVAVIYRKGVALGIAADALPRFEAHWQFLLGHEAIKASCPQAVLAG